MASRMILWHRQDPGGSAGGLQSDTKPPASASASHRGRSCAARGTEPPSAIGTCFVVELKGLIAASAASIVGAPRRDRAVIATSMVARGYLDHALELHNADGDLHERAPDRLECGSNLREHFVPRASSCAAASRCRCQAGLTCVQALFDQVLSGQNSSRRAPCRALRGLVI